MNNQKRENLVRHKKVSLRVPKGSVAISTHFLQKGILEKEGGW